MIYVGSLEQCENYNNLVTTEENFTSSTDRWADIMKKPDEELYAIQKHPNYDAEMNIVESISDWFVDA